MVKGDYHPKNWFESFNCAVEGIIFAVKTERHMQYHFAMVVAVILLGIILDLPLLEFVLFLFAFVILLFAEMLNTAVEVTVDMVAKEYDPLAKIAKDIAAGGVLISSAGVFIMGYVILTSYLAEPLSEAFGTIKGLTGYMSFFSLMLVFVGVAVSKAHFGKGTPLHGGMPSGHSAVAFSLWTSITLMTLNPLISILTFIMALMVSHSRLIGGIHTKVEVFWGAMLGMGITFLLFFLFA
jgi:diacylglycerol kinase (ATP)